MAKKTKDSNLSIEERLEQALVPNWDYPYEIPQNWKFFWFTKLIDIEGGTQPPKSNFVEYELDGYIRLVQIRDFSSDKYIVYVPDSHKLRHFNESDILIARYGASLGKICTGLKGVYNVALAKTIFSEKVLNRKYVYWMLHSEAFQNPLMAISRTAQAGFNKEDLSRFAMPLPPLEEQERIVVCIESLFAKLDGTREKAQEVVDGFETRKAAILHKAFSGELTAKWREKNGISFDEWSNKLFDECIEKMQNGLAKRAGNTGIPYVVLRLANLSDDGFVTDDLREIVLDEKEQKSYKLNVGDVVMIRVNGSKDNVAKQILVTEYNLWAFCDHIIRIKYNESVLPEYMVLYSKSEAYKIYVKDNIVSSAGQNTISRKGMARLSIPVPSIEEQKEIANILSDMFDKERRVKEIAEAVIEQIDTMKKAILARAFRGELGTNDPSEESAVELLKRFIIN